MSPRPPSGTQLKSFASSHRELSHTTHYVQIVQEACRSSSPNTFVVCWLLHPGDMGFRAEVAHLGVDVFADLLSVKMTASSMLCATTGVRLSMASSTILVTPSTAPLVVTTFGNHLSLVINRDKLRMVSMILIDCVCVTEHLRCSTLLANCINVMMLHIIKFLCCKILALYTYKYCTCMCLVRPRPRLLAIDFRDCAPMPS